MSAVLGSLSWDSCPETGAAHRLDEPYSCPDARQSCQATVSISCDHNLQKHTTMGHKLFVQGLHSLEEAVIFIGSWWRCLEKVKGATTTLQVSG